MKARYPKLLITLKELSQYALIIATFLILQYQISVKFKTNNQRKPSQDRATNLIHFPKTNHIVLLTFWLANIIGDLSHIISSLHV